MLVALQDAPPSADRVRRLSARFAVIVGVERM
jgi:hypothetical protein